MSKGQAMRVTPAAYVVAKSDPMVTVGTDISPAWPLSDSFERNDPATRFVTSPITSVISSSTSVGERSIIAAAI